jgi:Protein of unknown function (DUF4230)
MNDPDNQTPRINLARVQALPWLLFIAMLAIAAWLGMKAFGPPDHGNPVAATLVAFEKQNQLIVFSAELAPVVASEDSRLMGLVNSRQVAVIPARVDYTLDLSRMDASQLDWNPDKQVLAVRLPALTTSKPNLDEARAQYLREGVWISRDAQDSLSRKNTAAAEKLALQQAVNPVLLGLARTAAKDAIRQNLTIPLQVAGFREASVVVVFDGEEAPVAKSD